MTKPLKSHSRGFTLVELLVVLAMLGIVITAVYSLFTTHQKTAYMDEEMVDVQQNLRIAMESISKDVRMAGFLIRDANGTAANPNPGAGLIDNTVPVGRYDNNAADPLGQLQPLPPPNTNRSDSITLNMRSADSVYTKITAEISSPIAPGNSVTLPVESADYFSVEVPPQVVRIYDSGNFSEVRDAGGGIDSRLYTVQGVLTAPGACGVLTPPCLLLQAGGATATTIIYRPGYVIARTLAGADNPSWVRYSMITANCPRGPFCLARLASGAQQQIIATNIAGLQFSYLLDNGTELPNSASPLGPASLADVRAVRVTIWGQTEETKRFSGETRDAIVGNPDPAKTREVSSVVKIRNRYNR